MSSLMPEGAAIRKAVQWISKMRQEENTPLTTLIGEACVRFNLSPKDSEFLSRFFTEGEKFEGPKS
jgi:hypothetical protein